MTPNDEIYNEIIEYLIGTQESLERALEVLELELDIDEVLDVISNDIDVCLGCGLWSEVGELEGDHDIYHPECIPDE